MTREDVEEMIREVDDDDSGEIGFDEFVIMLHGVRTGKLKGIRLAKLQKGFPNFPIVFQK